MKENHFGLLGNYVSSSLFSFPIYLISFRYQFDYSSSLSLSSMDSSFYTLVLTWKKNPFHFGSSSSPNKHHF